jgi:hypothetical protein
MSDFYSYAAAVAARYGPGGSFWRDNPSLTALPVDTYEIWNEPDTSYFWHPSPDPATYAKLYTSARAAIVTVNPAAHVIIGGLTNPTSFISSLLAADPGIRGQVGGVAIHPYGPTPEHVLDKVRSVRLALNAEGLGGTPLYITEFGWTTRPEKSHDWAPAQLRPGFIWRTLAGLGRTDCGIAAVLMYAWATPEHNPNDSEDWYGISPPGATASPDTSAFSAGLHAGTGGPLNPLCSRPSPLAAPHKGSGGPARNRSRHKPHRRPHHRGARR